MNFKVANIIKEEIQLKNSIKTVAMWLILGIIFFILISSILDNSSTRLAYSELITKIEAGDVKEIEVASDGKKAQVTLKSGDLKKEVNIPSIYSFMDYIAEPLKAGNIKLSEKPESVFMVFLSLLTPFGILVIFLLFMFLTMNGGEKRKQNNVIRKK